MSKKRVLARDVQSSGWCHFFQFAYCIIFFLLHTATVRLNGTWCKILLFDITPIFCTHLISLYWQRFNKLSWCSITYSNMLKWVSVQTQAIWAHVNIFIKKTNWVKGKWWQDKINSIISTQKFTKWQFMACSNLLHPIIIHST